jgi:hypothetical protein
LVGSAAFSSKSLTIPKLRIHADKAILSTLHVPRSRTVARLIALHCQDHTALSMVLTLVCNSSWHTWFLCL